MSNSSSSAGSAPPTTTHSIVKKRPEDFVFGRVLGEGSYSTVVYAKENVTKTTTTSAQSSGLTTASSPQLSPGEAVSLHGVSEQISSLQSIQSETLSSTSISVASPSLPTEFAVKILIKSHIIREKKTKYVALEKDVLFAIKHPNIIRLYYTFQDSSCLYFVLEYCPNGDLLDLIRRIKRFPVSPHAAFIMAQLLAAVSSLHQNKILHRDLKLENILVDAKYHIKLTDFGTVKKLTEDTEKTAEVETNKKRESSPCVSKKEGQPKAGLVQSDHPGESRTVEAGQGGEQEKGEDGNLPGNVTPDYHTDPKTPSRRASFVGTAEYTPPELLQDRVISYSSDIWSLGVILYYLIVGQLPFKGATEYQTFQAILAAHFDVTGPLQQEYPVALDLIQRILTPHPSDRITADGIKAHPFLSGMPSGEALSGMKSPLAGLYANVLPPVPVKSPGSIAMVSGSLLSSGAQSHSGGGASAVTSGKTIDTMEYYQLDAKGYTGVIPEALAETSRKDRMKSGRKCNLM